MFLKTINHVYNIINTKKNIAKTHDVVFLFNHSTMIFKCKFIYM